MSTIDHTGISVSDFAKAKAFYSQALAPLGIAIMMEFPKSVTGDFDVAGYSTIHGGVVHRGDGEGVYRKHR